LRDGFIAAVMVTIAYLTFFGLGIATGHDVLIEFAVAQIAFQFVGFWIVARVLSWLLRRWG